MPHKRNLRERLKTMFADRREHLRRRLREVRSVLAIDFETTTDMKKGPRPHYGTDHIFSWQIADYDGKAESHRIEPGKIDPTLQGIMDDVSVAKVAHLFKFERTMLTVDGYSVPDDTVWHDSMILSQLLDNLRPTHALDPLAWVLAGWSRALSMEVHRLARLNGGFDRVPVNMLATYGEEDAQKAMMFFQTFWPEVSGALVDDYLNEIELVKVTQDMEALGLLLDKREAKKLVEWLTEQVGETEEEIEKIAGRPIAVTKPDDVAWLLHTRLEFPVLAYTGTGKISTRREVLQRLAEEHEHPIFDLIEKHRVFSRGVGIVSGYRNLTDEDGFVHPNINTNRAATGRESCDSPNLHNVAKSENRKSNYVVEARRVWRAPRGKVLVFFDQDGIEFRLITEAARSARMVEVIAAADRGEGPTPHVLFCTYVYGPRFKSKRESRDMYDAGKNGHFALCYAANDSKVAKTVGLPFLEAKPGIEKYRGDFPEISDLVRTGTDEVRRTGSIVTPFGRELRVPAEKPYTWLNYYIQGTAAGIIKRGQVQAELAVRDRWPADVAPIMSIHDEILFEVPVELVDDEKERAEFIECVSIAMTEIENINVPLVVGCKATRGNWEEAKEF